MDGNRFGLRSPLSMPDGLDSHRPTLSKRQEEILQAVALGTPDKLIAAALKVSTRTLEGHWRAIHRKLGCLNRCQAGFRFASLRESPYVVFGSGRSGKEMGPYG